METDALDLVLAGVLSVWNSEGTLYFIALYFKKLSPAEANYEI